MPIPDSELHREAIRRTLMHRAGGGTDALAIARATSETWLLICANLKPVIGGNGVDAILRKALFLASALFPWLVSSDEQVDHESLPARIRIRFAGRDLFAATQASSSLLIAFTELLVTLIGNTLSKQLLEPVWVCHDFACGAGGDVMNWKFDTMYSRTKMKNGGIMLRDGKSDSHGDAFSDRREEVSSVATMGLRPRKNAKIAKTEFSTNMEASLREANENLVVASVNAQVMTEAVERIMAHLSHTAEHDLLTNLPNRTLLADRLVQSILLAKRHGSKLALMFLDIDHFKRINDSMGHAIGDQVLQSVAKRLQSSVRISDTVSRHGGDEFVILLPEIGDVPSVAHFAEKLIQSVGMPHFISGQELCVTLSIGISIYPDDGVEAEVLMRNADISMYKAKRMGGNSYEIYTQRMNASLQKNQVGGGSIS